MQYFIQKTSRFLVLRIFISHLSTHTFKAVMKFTWIFLIIFPYINSCPLEDFFSENSSYFQAVIYLYTEKDLLDKMNYHKEQAFISIKKAESICILLPDLDDQTMANNCLASVFGFCGVGISPLHRLLNAALVVLAQYTYHCVNEWHVLQTTLQEAEHHLDLYGFYKNLLKWDYIRNKKPIPEDW